MWLFVCVVSAGFSCLSHLFTFEPPLHDGIFSCLCWVWNGIYLDVEFGRVQARDMLQHLCTGPISNAAVDVVPGGWSVEVRPVGVSKVTTVLSIYYLNASLL